jgi:hypothetical protein
MYMLVHSSLGYLQHSNMYTYYLVFTSIPHHHTNLQLPISHSTSTTTIQLI